MPFTDQENDTICRLSFQAWDYLVDMIGRGTAEQLKGYVAEPHELVKNRSSVAAVFRDAVPVYLDLSTGKIIVRWSTLDERLNRIRRKREAAKDENIETEEVTSVKVPSDAYGASRREKNRSTCFCRQKISGIWDPQVAVPVGRE